MTHCYGYRRKTRKIFARPFKDHGTQKLSKHLTTFKAGEYVDIVTDGSQHKGMPYKQYHGRTGKIFNVNPHSVGVEILKVVRSRYQLKRVHLRLEHVRKSRCRDSFIARVQVNDKKKAEANKQGKIISTKRLPVGPREAHQIKKPKIEFQHPKAFHEVF